MKKILAIFLSLIIIPVSFAGCGGCGKNKEYAGTYIGGSGFDTYTLTLTASGKFTYKKNNSVSLDPESNISGTYTIDDSGEETKITLFWRDTNSINPVDAKSVGTISKSGKTISVKIHGSTKSFKKQ